MCIDPGDGLDEDQHSREQPDEQQFPDAGTLVSFQRGQGGGTGVHSGYGAGRTTACRLPAAGGGLRCAFPGRSRTCPLGGPAAVVGRVQIIHRPTDFVFHGAYFHNGDVEVHVVQESVPGRLSRHAPEWGGEELRTGLCHHFAVMVDSFEPFLAAMRERGLERVGGPRVRDDYVEQIYIADPDGHVIELLYQHSPESGHARRIEIFDLGIAVSVAPGHHVLDPRAKYGPWPA